MMQRRTFVAGMAAVMVPRASEAQQAGTVPTIGLMGSGTAAAQRSWTTAFVQRLRELGWREGKTVGIQYRWAEGRSDRFIEIAAEFVRLKVDLIVTHNTPPTVAAKNATAVIPIVFATAGEPVASGIVTSLARPGGNVTGLSSQAPDAAGKRLGLIREVIPGLHRLGVLADVGNTYALLDAAEVEKMARFLGVEVMRSEIRVAEDIDPAFEAIKGRAQALYVIASPLVFANLVRINDLALVSRLPTSHTVREYVDAGGLMSYGPDWRDMWSRAADIVDKILRGTKPADIPVQQPSKFEFVINLKTAKALGLTIPASVLARADHIIE